MRGILGDNEMYNGSLISEQSSGEENQKLFPQINDRGILPNASITENLKINEIIFRPIYPENT